MKLEIIITQRISHPDFSGTTVSQYRYTDLSIASDRYEKLRANDIKSGGYVCTTIEIVEVIEQ